MNLTSQFGTHLARQTRFKSLRQNPAFAGRQAQTIDFQFKINLNILLILKNKS